MADICLHSSLVSPPRTPADGHILRPAEASSDATSSSQLCPEKPHQVCGRETGAQLPVEPDLQEVCSIQKSLLYDKNAEACRPSPCCPQGPHGPP